MGLEALCVARKGEQSGEGQALLETDYLLFRGSFRFKIPFKEIKGVKADAGQLVLSCGDGPVCLGLGAAAEKWANKILHPPQRIDKLGVKSGMQIVLLGIKDNAFPSEVAARSAEISSRLRKDADIVFLGMEKKADLRKLPTARRSVKATGSIWVVYPKGIQAITEDEVLQSGRQAGLVDVKVASFSATHTALKFVIPVAQR